MDETSKKFTFKVDQHNYGSSEDKQQVFHNYFGSWTIDINRDGSGKFTGKITLKSTKELTWEKMKIQLKFLNTNNSSYSATANAQYDEVQEVFLFSVSTSYSLSSPYYTVEIEVDATACTLALPKASKTNDYSKEMFNTGLLADVTIKTEDGQEIMAHNLFLSRSDVFYAMLNKHDTKEAQEKVIKVTDVNHDVLVEMIRFLYCDEVPKINEMALELLLAADKYNIQGLINECAIFLWNNVNTQNYAPILIAADQLKIEYLKDKAISCITGNCEEIFLSETWKQLEKNNVQLALEVTKILCTLFDLVLPASKKDKNTFNFSKVKF